MPGIHILTGANVPDKEKALKAVLARELPKERSGHNFEVYHASEAPVAEIGNALSTGSLFETASVILIRDCQELSSGGLEDLAPYVAALASGNTLIMEGTSMGRVGKTHPIWRALEQSEPKARLEEFPVPKPWEMAEWLMEQCRDRFGRPLDRESAELLLETVGPETGSLIAELEKIDLVLPKKKAVTGDDIRTYASTMRQRTPWELPEPVALKDLGRALSILDNLFAFGKAQGVALPVVSSLFGHFTALLKLKLYFEDHPEKRDKAVRAATAFKPGRFHPCPELADIANESGFLGRILTPFSAYPVMGKSRMIRQVENFTLDQFNYALRLLATADEDLKSGGLWRPDFASLSRLLIFLVHGHRFRTSTRYD